MWANGASLERSKSPAHVCDHMLRTSSGSEGHSAQAHEPNVTDAWISGLGVALLPSGRYSLQLPNCLCHHYTEADKALRRFLRVLRSRRLSLASGMGIPYEQVHAYH